MKIINLDIDGLCHLRRLHGDAHILRECSLVFRDAKKALKMLNGFDLHKLHYDDSIAEDEIGGRRVLVTTSVGKLLGAILVLEQHELSEVDEWQRNEDKLYVSWHDNVFTPYFYHGTTSLMIERIMRYGLSPTMRPWDPHDWDRFNELFMKGGLSIQCRI